MIYEEDTVEAAKDLILEALDTLTQPSERHKLIVALAQRCAQRGEGTTIRTEDIDQVVGCIRDGRDLMARIWHR